MSRIYFSPSSATDLKTTLSNSITLANAIFWTTFYEINSKFVLDVEFDKFGDNGVSIKQFKPSRMKLYNRCAVAFGYNNWNELVETSKSRDNLILDPIFIHQEKLLQQSLMDVFIGLFYEFLPLPDDHSIHYLFDASAKQAAFLITNAIVLHSNEKHDETGLAKAFLNVDPDAFDGKGLIVAGMEPNMLEIALLCNFDQLLPNFLYKNSDEAMKKALESYHLPMILDLYKADSKVARFGYEPPQFAYRLELGNPDKKHAFAGVMSLISWFSEHSQNGFSRYNELRNEFFKTGMKEEDIEYMFSENKTRH